ncbi:MAG: sugar phosphate isomerase/epimerase [Verrucomicrobia bacterium]|nr:sugar phosphate isomerase/epimerase [Verrucomicrobiota bacterium]MCG2680852.1 sugar phosphate isomerase/epimerase [Kiritimatiellia bacterium]MBU4246862.1 sugar phosphate isomerase/epimerase [Verrucomicrobiota bacterium]MBU4290392.1 sugar phosphate isomerase/epimerase [Verrucomicrobiota bacterium]MBU4430243.1 sugar phosphate isomerase/epimerase [Verrucomicrobiota bacterium]
MKTSCSSWSYHRTIQAGSLDQMGWVRECAALGLDGIELLGYHFPSKDREYLIRLRKACADHFLSVAMVSADGHLTVTDDAQREIEVNNIGEWVKVAAFLGAPCVRFFCGSGKELEAGGKPLYRKVLKAVKKVVRLGAKKGIVMAMENHGGTTAEQLLALQKDVKSEFFKFTLDTGNFPPTSQVGPQTYESIERCAPHAAIVHAKFFNVLPDGRDRDFDWSRIRSILEKVGFRGFLSVEYEGEEADEVAVMRRIAPFLKTLR